MRSRDLLLVLATSVVWSVWSFLLHERSLLNHSARLPADDALDAPIAAAAAASRVISVSGSSTTDPEGDGGGFNVADDEHAHTIAHDGVETILIIATVPYKSDHVMALWTHLECVTGGIDRVVVAAPDTAWSREIVGTIASRFEELSRGNAAYSFGIETAFFTNNRYDVGLWCDGLGLHLGFDGANFPPDGGKNATRNGSAAQRAIFLINDSTAALRPYDGLTSRIVGAARRKQLNDTTPGSDIKVISLNGNLVQPQGWDIKSYWVESVYRGLAPEGVATFYKHSCTPDAARACVGKTDNAKKQCIVSRYEMSLARSYAASEVDAMYPTYLPKEWDASSWEASGGRIGPTDQWIRGRRYFRYLRDVHDFPFRKIKWPERGQGAPPTSERCLKLMGGAPQFENLPYPSAEDFKAFQQAMLESEASL